MIFISFFIVFGDCIYNRKEIFNREFFRDIKSKDPYFFRVEMFLLVLGFIWFLIINTIYNFFINPIGLLSIKIIREFLDAFNELMLTFIFCGFPLILSIYNTITNKIERQNLNNSNGKISIDYIFQTPELLALFTEYAEYEWSVENVLVMVFFII